MHHGGQRGDERNSSCGLFMAIILVLMLFGNSHATPEQRTARRDSYGWGNRITTTLPALVTLEPGGTEVPNPDLYTCHTPTLSPEAQQRNKHSVQVVVFLFGSLMMVQVLGFCMVVVLRRRARNRAQNSELFTASLHRDLENGWNPDADDDSADDDGLNTLNAHPALASLRSSLHPGRAQQAPGAQVGLPSYAEALSDPDGLGLPGYTADAVEHPIADAAASIDAAAPPGIDDRQSRSLPEPEPALPLSDSDSDSDSNEVVVSLAAASATPRNPAGSSAAHSAAPATELAIDLDLDDGYSDDDDDKAPLMG